MLMSNFKFWGWDKKLRTMLRFVKPGDIFCFQLNNKNYRFGRIMSFMTVGHISEIFDIESEQPIITDDAIKHAKRIIEPIILDTYSLFDKKIETGSDWRIIGHQNNYSPDGVDNIYFAFGIGDNCKKKDFNGNVTSITTEEWEKMPKLSPHGDYDIKKLLDAI
ncbi:hypothetical protein PROSTU_03721 [Providencia stuartii ATCC 25827]|uniref:Phosphotriesterase n=2 Tax=Morganellaceae TaxID=1903414 RepID=A0AA86YXP8_PROST|nr:hypothetical protein PROSTU_03721 [Providencia stuartii ATCC 25827]